MRTLAHEASALDGARAKALAFYRVAASHAALAFYFYYPCDIWRSVARHRREG